MPTRSPRPLEVMAAVGVSAGTIVFKALDGCSAVVLWQDLFATRRSSAVPGKTTASTTTGNGASVDTVTHFMPASRCMPAAFVHSSQPMTVNKDDVGAGSTSGLSYAVFVDFARAEPVLSGCHCGATPLASLLRPWVDLASQHRHTR